MMSHLSSWQQIFKSGDTCGMRLHDRGKTGLCLDLLKEAAINNIPAIIFF